MKGAFLMIVLFLGLAAASPTKHHKTLHSRKNHSSESRLGIYDGKNTTIAKHNYLVGILINGEFACAGAIVSESYVLTIGFYVEDFHASALTVVAGSKDGTSGISYSVEEVIVNPSYIDITDLYNFALLEISGTFTWGSTVGHVTLPSANPKSGAALVVTGYGNTNSSGVVGEGTLLQGTMKYMPAADCESYYTDYYLDWDDSMACAYDQGGVTMCEGDDGNPFTEDSVLYGLMADGGDSDEFCNSEAIPVIIANVYTVVDWVNEYIS